MTASHPHTSPSLRPSPLFLACLVLMAGPVLAQTAPAPTQMAQGGSAGTLRETVISGSRSERAIEDVPASIDVITGEDLDPARVQDIRDLAREIPNVSVKRAPQRFGGVTGSTGRDGNAGFNIRGLEGNRVLLTVDGIRVPRELSSGVFGSAAFGRDYYDLGLISRVEILRGANSALYGSDGLAGMVAMFTTEPKDLLKPGQSFGGRVGLRASTDDDSRGVGVTLVGKPSDALQWLGSVQVGRSGELDNQGENHSLNSNRTAPNPQKDKSVSALGKVVLTPGGGQRHTLTLEHVDKSGDVEAYSARSTSATGTQDVDGTTDMERTRLSWDGRFKLGTGWADELRATVGYQQAESREVSVEQRTAAPTYRVRDVTYTEKLWQGVLQAEKARTVNADWSQKLVYGVDVSVAKLDNVLTGVAPPGTPPYETYPLKRFPPTRETNTALFVQSEFATERWSVIPALRYDRFDIKAESSPLYPLQPTSLSDSALSPKLGVIFRPASSWSVFANLAAGFKAPSPLQLNNNFQNPTGFPVPYETLPNPNLRPEKSRTFELGARGRSSGFEWDAAVFTGRYKDFIEDLVVIQRAPRVLYQSLNLGRVTLSGFELKGRFALTSATDLRLAYGQTRGKDTALNQPLNSVNPARLVLGVDHRIGDWKLGALVAHTMKKSTSDINYTNNAAQFAPPSFTTLDLRASWQVSRATRLSAAIHNVTDRKYWEWANVNGVAANSPVLDAYTAPGRSLSLALVTDF